MELIKKQFTISVTLEEAELIAASLNKEMQFIRANCSPQTQAKDLPKYRPVRNFFGSLAGITYMGADV